MHATLNQENYYEDNTYVSSSSLKNYVKYVYGNPIYSIQNYLNPPPIDSDNVMIGKILDEILTEGINPDDKYEVVATRKEKTDKLTLKFSYADVSIQRIKDILSTFGIQEDSVKEKVLKTSATIAIQLPLAFNPEPIITKLMEEGFIFEVDYMPAQDSRKIQITKSMDEAIATALRAITSASISPDETFDQYIHRPTVTTQAIFTDEDLKLKCKVDFIEETDTEVIETDLKCTGSIDMVGKEMFIKGIPNTRHPWIRQRAIYAHLLKVNFPGKNVRSRIAIVSHSGDVLIKEIGPRVLEAAWSEVLRDIISLRATLESGAYVECVDFDGVEAGATPEEVTSVILSIKEDPIIQF